MADPPDTTPPTVTWQNTDMSSVVVGGRTMTVSASDDIAVTAVEFDIDGVLYANAADNGDGTWSAEFNAASWDEGPVTIDAIASDAAGNQSQVASISFTDSHDMDQPFINSVTIGTTTLAPADWAQLPPDYLPAVFPTVSGATHFVVNADDNEGVTSVLYSTDGESTWHPMTFLSGSDWSATIDAETLAGTGVLFLQLTDAAGNNFVDGIGLNVQTAPQLIVNQFDIGNSSNEDPNAVPQVGNYLVVSGGNAIGNPDPAISYLWSICHGTDCTTATGWQYIVQSSDVGADISVTVIADNGVGQPATLPHDFGIAVAAPVFEMPTGPQFGDGPPADTTPAPTPAPAPAPVVPPVPDLTPLIKAIDEAQKGVDSTQTIVDNTKTIMSNVQNAVTSVKHSVAKAVGARKAAEKKAAAAKRNVAGAKADLQDGTATPAERKHFTAAKAKLALAKQKQDELLKLEEAKKKALAEKQKAEQNAKQKLADALKKLTDEAKRLADAKAGLGKQQG